MHARADPGIANKKKQGRSRSKNNFFIFGGRMGEVQGMYKLPSTSYSFSRENKVRKRKRKAEEPYILYLYPFLLPLFIAFLDTRQMEYFFFPSKIEKATKKNKILSQYY